MARARYDWMCATTFVQDYWTTPVVTDRLASHARSAALGTAFDLLRDPQLGEAQHAALLEFANQPYMLLSDVYAANPYGGTAIPPALLQHADTIAARQFTLPQYDLRLHPEMQQRVQVLRSIRRFTCSVIPKLLAQFDGSIVLAGGSLSTLLRNPNRRPINHPGDFDLFIVSATLAGALATFTAVVTYLGHLPCLQRIVSTARAVTFYMYDTARGRAFEVQVILRHYISPAAVLASFDLDCCYLLLTGLTIFASERYLWAAGLGYNIARAAATAPSRFLKYARRGVASLTDAPVDLVAAAAAAALPVHLAPESGGPGVPSFVQISRVSTPGNNHALCALLLLDSEHRLTMRSNSSLIDAQWERRQDNIPANLIQRVHTNAAAVHDGVPLLARSFLNGQLL